MKNSTDKDLYIEMTCAASENIKISENFEYIKRKFKVHFINIDSCNIQITDNIHQSLIDELKEVYSNVNYIAKRGLPLASVRKE